MKTLFSKSTISKGLAMWNCIASSAVLSLLIGSICIAAGGLLTTHGWNMHNLKSQKKSIFEAVRSECLVNDQMLTGVLGLVAEGHIGFSHQAYHSAQLTNALTSGVLKFHTDKGKQFRDALDSYARAVDDFNAGLRIVGRHVPGMFVQVAFISDPASMKDKPLDSVLSDKFKNLRDSHGALMRLLDHDYRTFGL